MDNGTQAKPPPAVSETELRGLQKLYVRGMMGVVLMMICTDVISLPASGRGVLGAIAAGALDAVLTALLAFVIAHFLFRPILRLLKRGKLDSPDLAHDLDRLPFRSAAWTVLILIMVALIVAAAELAKHGALEVFAWMVMITFDSAPNVAVYAYCVGWRTAFQVKSSVLPRTQTDESRQFSCLRRLGIIGVVLVLGHALYGVFSEAVLTNFPKAVIDGYPARGFWPNLNSFLSGGIALVLILWHLRPVGRRSIDDILDALRSFRTERLDVRLTVVEDNEFGFIAESFNELADHVEDRVQERTRQLREAHEELRQRYDDLQQDLTLAKAVQLSLIRQGVEVPGCRAAIRYVPMIGIGGDYAWAQPLDDDRLFMAICDVSGHGIAASLLTNRIHAECVHLVEQGQPPGELLLSLNRFARPLLPSGNFFTFFAATIDARTGRLSYAGGGHPPIILMRSGGECITLESQGTILGVLDSETGAWRADEIRLAKGDALFLYSDGIAEARNSRGKLWGGEGLVGLVRRSAGLDPQRAADTLMDGYLTHLAGKAEDDVSLIVAMCV